MTHLLFFFHFLRLLFLEQFYVYNKIERYGNFLYPHCPNIHITPLSASHTRGAYWLQLMSPTLMHHIRPKSIVYITVHSWWCAFLGFKQMCNDMYLSLQYHRDYFYCPQNPLCSAYSSLPWPTLEIADFFFFFFTVSVDFPFPECHIVGII